MLFPKLLKKVEQEEAEAVTILLCYKATSDKPLPELKLEESNKEELRLGADKRMQDVRNITIESFKTLLFETLPQKIHRRK